MMISIVIILLLPRYDSEGNHLGSLPDLITARNNHACSTFTSDGEEVLSAHLINIVFQNRKGSNVVSLSFVLQTGLAGCWRLERWEVIQNRSFHRWQMVSRRKPSQVKIFVKSFEFIIIIIATVIIIISFKQ